MTRKRKTTKVLETRFASAVDGEVDQDTLLFRTSAGAQIEVPAGPSGGSLALSSAKGAQFQSGAVPTTENPVTIPWATSNDLAGQGAPFVGNDAVPLPVLPSPDVHLSKAGLWYFEAQVGVTFGGTKVPIQIVLSQIDALDVAFSYISSGYQPSRGTPMGPTVISDDQDVLIRATGPVSTPTSTWQLQAMFGQGIPEMTSIWATLTVVPVFLV